MENQGFLDHHHHHLSSDQGRAVLIICLSSQLNKQSLSSLTSIFCQLFSNTFFQLVFALFQRFYLTISRSKKVISPPISAFLAAPYLPLACHSLTTTLEFQIQSDLDPDPDTDHHGHIDQPEQPDHPYQKL